MEKIIREGLKKGKVEKLKGDFSYMRFAAALRGIERGTAIIGKRVVWGYPHIKRIFSLEKGVLRNLSGDIYAEEKIDGFNVRVAAIDGRICAFTRGGFLDSFVTEKAREMKLEKFFRKHPGHVLCGEMIGNTPYTSPAKDFDVQFFVFDIDTGDGSYLAPQEKYDVLQDYGIRCVPRLGKAKDMKELKKLVLAVLKGKKEGMVFRSSDGRSTVKYVTPFTDVDDIDKSSMMFFDMPIGFYYQRILRSAFFIDEFGLDHDEYAEKLGKAFYKGLIKAIRDVKDGREIDQEFEILIRDKKIWDDIGKHMSREVGLEKLWEKEEKGKTRIRFRKIYRKTTKELSSYAKGKGTID